MDEYKSRWEVVTKKDGARYLVANIHGLNAEISAHELREFLPSLYESISYTRRQLQIMEFVRDFRRFHKISPTLGEVADKFGVSEVTICEHMDQLERRGAIKREKYKTRSIQPLDPTFL